MAKKKPTKAKKIVLISLGILLLGLSILTALRWNAWFGNRPEAPYRTPDRIDRITLTPGVNFASERTISWRYGEQTSTAWLEYGLAEGDTTFINRTWLPAKGTKVSTRGGHGYYYTATMYGLIPGKKYHYRLHNNATFSPVHSFTIPDSLDQRQSFLYLGDVQDAQGDESFRMFQVLRSNISNIDFLALGGDQIEAPINHYWDLWYQALGDWSTSLPIIVAIGNHEYRKKGFLRELDPRWVPQYNYPPNGPSGFEGRTYFVDMPLARYIVLDTNGMNGPIDVLRHRSWLTEVLRTSAQPWQIVMFHHAVHTVREGRFHPLIHYGFKGVLEDYGADLVLQGHDHAYGRATTKASDGRDTIAPVYIVSSSSPKVYQNGFDDVHDRLGSGLQLYQKIDLTSKSLRYRSFKYDGTLYDDLELSPVPGSSEKVRVVDNARNIPEEFRYDHFKPNKKGRKKAQRYQENITEYLDKKIHNK